MIGKLLFGVTFIIVIILGISSLQSHSGGDKYGSSYASAVFLFAYAFSSLLLTIYILVNGGFNWISDNSFIRYGVVVILWFGVLAVGLCCIERIEIHKYYQMSGFVRYLSVIISYCGIWLPLLILIPYYFFLKPEWQNVSPPIMIKISLILACVLGFLFLIAPKIKLDFLSKNFKKFDERELAFNHAMDNLSNYKDVASLLYYTSNENDEQIRTIAFTKIKACKNHEDELIRIMEDGNPYSVFSFLEENKVEKPERFVEPLIKSFPMIIADMREEIESERGSGAIDLGPILGTLEGQFIGSLPMFKPYIVKLQEAMEASPAKSRLYHDPEKCREKLQKNREEIKDWLARH